MASVNCTNSITESQSEIIKIEIMEIKIWFVITKIIFIKKKKIKKYKGIKT